MIARDTASQTASRFAEMGRSSVGAASSFLRGRFWALQAIPFMTALSIFAQAPEVSPPEAEPVVAAPHPSPTPEPRRVRQPIHEYFTSSDTAQNPGPQKLALNANPFVSYTHLGTDYGLIGPGREDLGWEAGTVVVDLPSDTWAGMWHSLAGLGNNSQEVMDFQACFPSLIQPAYQPRIVGVEFRARGAGQFKIEIKDAEQHTLWTRTIELDTPDMKTVVESVEPSDIRRAKFINWVAEPGSKANVDSLAFIVQTPDIPFDEYVFLTGYAKLARSYSPDTGYMRDRAHVRAGHFDNVPAAGMFALGTALAMRQGMVDAPVARDIIRQLHGNISGLDTAQGWLPHFILRDDAGKWGIVPGTEFSTVDTAIYYHAMILAAEISGDRTLLQSVESGIKAITLESMVNTEGFISHGLKHDKVSVLPSVWRDWGGETALVLSLVNMTGKAPAPRMDTNGKIHEGIGFIAEIQSLFFPDFDSTAPDKLSKQNWLAIRRDMLLKQREYFPRTWPESRAAQLGFYGLSAGEARHGIGYMVSGVDIPQQRYIHPHYVLMAGCLDANVENVYDLLRRMEKELLMPPWGMVEHFSKDLDEYLAMQGALNAGFECIGAYQMLARHRGTQNLIHEASRANSDLRSAARIFYDAPPTALVEGATANPLSAR